MKNIVKQIAKWVLRDELRELRMKVKYFKDKAYGQDIVLPQSVVTEILQHLPSANEASKHPEMLYENRHIADALGNYTVEVSKFACGQWLALKVQPLGIIIYITHRRDKMQANVLGCNLEIDTYCWDFSHSGIRVVSNWEFMQVADFIRSSTKVAKETGMLDY